MFEPEGQRKLRLREPNFQGGRLRSRRQPVPVCRWIGATIYRRSIVRSFERMLLVGVGETSRSGAAYHQRHLAKSRYGRCGIGGCSVPFRLAEL